ncbi:MAG: hypothetical protein RI883_143 [Bacteroidota bacterium]|jgi:putative membrane protein
MADQVRNVFQKYKSSALLAILIIFYCVGLVGLLIPDEKEYFLSLSFLNLILSFCIMILARKTNIFLFLSFLLLCFFVGITVELIGTKTGLLFGNYAYGNNLGYKLSGVPIVIGLNWGILIATSASIANVLKSSIPIKIIVSVGLMILLDFLMEPVAMKSDFWNWKNETIPFYNYICWGLVSFPLQLVYFKFKIVETNIVFNVLFIILSLFFLILNLF